MMTTFYSVVQYVPDSTADERINIGVLVAGEDGIRARFVDDWRRARLFGAEPVGYLKDFAESVRVALSRPRLISESADPSSWTVDTLTEMARTWNGVIQVSAPRTAVLRPEELLEDIAASMLRGHISRDKQQRDKAQLVARVSSDARDALRTKYSEEAAELVKTRFPVRGASDKQPWDVVLENGTELGEAYLAAQGLALTALDTATRRHEANDAITLAAWAADDLRQRDTDFPLAVVISQGAERNPIYERAVSIFRHLRVQLLEEQDAGTWVYEQTRKPEIAAFFAQYSQQSPRPTVTAGS
jgi:Protein of unknown function (DUF3037)